MHPCRRKVGRTALLLGAVRGIGSRTRGIHSPSWIDTAGTSLVMASSVLVSTRSGRAKRRNVAGSRCSTENGRVLTVALPIRVGVVRTLQQGCQCTLSSSIGTVVAARIPVAEGGGSNTSGLGRRGVRRWIGTSGNVGSASHVRSSSVRAGTAAAPIASCSTAASDSAARRRHVVGAGRGRIRGRDLAVAVAVSVLLVALAVGTRRVVRIRRVGRRRSRRRILRHVSRGRRRVGRNVLAVVHSRTSCPAVSSAAAAATGIHTGRGRAVR